MNKEEKKTWMAVWCANNGAQLQLNGECGFGRECVGIITNESYPDYEWYGEGEDEWNRVDSNGDVWTPEDAYHKHPCVAVLGRGDDAEDQLYQWLKWFDDNNYKIETGLVEGVIDPILILLGKHQYRRMVKQ